MREKAPILIIDENGDKYWRNKKGKLHRIDGPAIEYDDGTKEWYQMGLKHRIDGPAIEFNSGVKHWYQNGVLHRIDGPAIEYSNGDKFWFYNNVKFPTKEAFFEALSDEEKEIAILSEHFKSIFD
jgi:hypothetical protein